MGQRWDRSGAMWSGAMHAGAARLAVVAIAAVGCLDGEQPHGQGQAGPRRGVLDAHDGAGDAAATSCKALALAESEDLFVRCIVDVEQTAHSCLAGCDAADIACSHACRSSAGRGLYLCRATHLDDGGASAGK